MQGQLTGSEGKTQDSEPNARLVSHSQAIWFGDIQDSQVSLSLADISDFVELITELG